MIIVFRPGATDEDIDHVSDRLQEIGLTPHISRGVQRTLMGAIGDEKLLDAHPVDAWPGVERVIPILKPYKLASREFRKETTVVSLGDGVLVGGRQVALMIGPCAVESATQMDEIASFLAGEGVRILRGGAYKPRTSPYSFQGLGEEGLIMLRETADRYGMKVVTEVVDVHDVQKVCECADMLQIGARNMSNFSLLRHVGQAGKPVLLKRGMASGVQELLLASEYILKEGNHDVALCERGIRTFETAMRNTLDLAAVAFLKLESHLPVIVDPSHATGLPELVAPMSRAALAAGADGLLIDIHTRPEMALCDGFQALRPEAYRSLRQSLETLAPVLGRSV